MKHYSIIHQRNEKIFRYNYTDSELEYIYIDFNRHGCAELEDLTILDAQGLSRYGWEHHTEEYLDRFSSQIDEEVNYLMEELKEEFGYLMK